MKRTKTNSYAHYANLLRECGRRRGSTWDRHAARFPFIAESPDGAIPMIVRTAADHPIITMLRADGKTRRWRFQTRSQRDSFVHVFRDYGAVSGGRS